MSTWTVIIRIQFIQSDITDQANNLNKTLHSKYIACYLL